MASLAERRFSPPQEKPLNPQSFFQKIIKAFTEKHLAFQRGGAQEVFARTKWEEKKSILLEEMFVAAERLTYLSFDIEENLDWYYTAPDDQVRARIIQVMLPEKPQVLEKPELFLRKMAKLSRQAQLEKKTDPHAHAEERSQISWRRTVHQGADLFLKERKNMHRIQLRSKQDPRFDEKLFYGVVPDQPAEYEFTPLGLIVYMEDDDYVNVFEKHIAQKNEYEAHDPVGGTYMEHDHIPELSHRLTFIKNTRNKSIESKNKTIRHELFHIFSQVYLNKAKKNTTSRITERWKKKQRSFPELYEFIDILHIALRSDMVEETSAYIFDDQYLIDTHRTNGDIWNGYLRHLHIPEFYNRVQPDESEMIQLIDHFRTLQSLYLFDARTLQITTTLFAEKIKNSPYFIDDETRKRFMTFFLSQWQGTKMHRIADALQISPEKVDDFYEKEVTNIQDHYQNAKKKISQNSTLEASGHYREALRTAAVFYPVELLHETLEAAELCLRNNAIHPKITAELLTVLEDTLVLKNEKFDEDLGKRVEQVLQKVRQHKNDRIKRHAGTMQDILLDYKNE